MHPDLFDSAFTISRPVAPDAVQMEIAKDNKIQADTFFLVRLNDKAAAGMMNAVASALKTTFGTENIAILFENESRL
jgi:hypothetical protein